MEDIKNIQSIYFIGIGGIGMSALARYFHNNGVSVSGYDKTETALTRRLQQSGININYDDNIMQLDKAAEVVVYTPAIKSNHQQLTWYRNNKYNVVKRSDVLQWLTENSFNICVGGTHGKTTVSTMIGHILRHSGYGCNAFLGGISANYETNFWGSDNNVCVIEADEYDRSFLKLKPNVAVITSMDPDHLDIYGTATEMENAFLQFANSIKDGGTILYKYGLKRASEFVNGSPVSYSFNNAKADVYTTNLSVQNGGYLFNVVGKNWSLQNVELFMGGLHNIENSVAAITVARHLKIEDEKIKMAIADFKGVKRRFEYILHPLKNNEDVAATAFQHVLIDDYAHHPEELKALFTGVHSLFPGKKCTVVFQPHLYSRTKDLAIEFAASLDMTDEVVLLPIYAARELPMDGVNSEMILKYMHLPRKQVLEKDQLLNWVREKKPELLVMCGAGDIDALVGPVKNILNNN